MRYFETTFSYLSLVPPYVTLGIEQIQKNEPRLYLSASGMFLRFVL
jgi:hypothetical protein